MEPVTVTIETAKEVYEAAKKIQQVYNVSKEMKNVAESEGTDQIVATKDLASSTGNIAKESFGKEEGSSKGDLKDSGNIKEAKESSPFVEPLDSSNNLDVQPTVDAVFVEKCPEPEINANDSTIEANQIDNSNEVATPESTDSNQATEEALDSNSPLENNEVTNVERQGLTEEEKNEIKEKTGWSDKIVDAIRTKEEAQIYMDAGLVEGEVNGKPALLQPRIDGNACNEPKWPDWSNKDLAEEGYPPRDENGRPYELHHIGQNPDSPLAELTYEQHHCNGNFKILHTFEESSIDRLEFNKERRIYWEERSKTL
jgi:hypothetical protein